MNRPIGTLMTVVIPVMSRVPTIAWYAPPPAPTTPRIDSLKKAPSNRAAPRLTTTYSRDTSGTIAIPKAAVTAVAASRSVARRVPSTARETAVVPATKTNRARTIAATVPPPTARATA